MKKTTLASVLSVLSLFSFLSAQETTSDTFLEDSTGNHVIVGISPEKVEKEDNETATEEHHRDIQDLRVAPEEHMACIFSFHTAPPHWVTNISVHGDAIEMEDGSRWKTPASKAHVLFGWKAEEPLLINPNRSYFYSSFNYYITNRHNKSSIPANLYLGPLDRGRYTHWIIGIDPTKGHVFLENDTAWIVSSNDAAIFKDWNVNHTIILGSNDRWFTSYDHILINVDMNNYIEAKQY